MSDASDRNRLAGESSPYLLQHAGNPVDWYPWGPEALQRARDEQRPILLSVGYAACHWCHVMEHESFEDSVTAALMNDGFVCIKVDREERPDIDDIYMRAVQTMTGHGGWPLTVFLTPDLEPFYGGTYFPPEPRPGMPAFRQVLEGVTSAFQQRPDEVGRVAAELGERLQAVRLQPGPTQLLGEEVGRSAARELMVRFDGRYGGFGGAPKFPAAMSLSLLLRHAAANDDAEARDAVLLTLERMAAGGIHDQLGGGFHRYATDARWLVPHFEKMLYDNALLTPVYLEAFQSSDEERFAGVARSTLDWAIREMQADTGGFYSTLDADSEGVEGKFYVWSAEELATLLGDDAEPFAAAYGVTEGGNWEGTNILHLPRSLAATAAGLGLDIEELEARLAAARQLLLERRAARVWPALDDKVLSDWNGLMISALARAHRVLGEPRYLDAARRAASFVLDAMVVDGRLMHATRDGVTRIPAFLDGQAAMLGGCLDLFLSTFELHWLRRAVELAENLVTLFRDDTDGGFFFTGADHEALIARPKSGHDAATPAGNALAAAALERLGRLTGDATWSNHARDTVYAFAPFIHRTPSAFGAMLLALDDRQPDHGEVVVVGNLDDAATQAALGRLWRPYAPHRLILAIDPGAVDRKALEAIVPLLAGKEAATKPGKPTFFACRDQTCEAPTQDLATILDADPL